MRLSVSDKIAVGAAFYVSVVLLIVAGSSARGGGGPGFGPPNNPGTEGSQFGRATASGIGTQPTQGGPGFGAGNNPGSDGSAYGRSMASDASSGRSDGHGSSFFHSGAEEEVVDTDSGSAKKKEERNASTNGSARALSRISSQTGIPVDTLEVQKSATGLGYGELEIANLLAKASGQSFDSIVGKFKAGEGWGKIARDRGLNLGKIVSDAHRSNLKNEGKRPDEGSSGINRKLSLIPPPGIRNDSILFEGITPVPSATVSRGVNPVPSATMGPRP